MPTRSISCRVILGLPFLILPVSAQYISLDPPWHPIEEFRWHSPTYTLAPMPDFWRSPQFFLTKWTPLAEICGTLPSSFQSSPLDLVCPGLLTALARFYETTGDTASLRMLFEHTAVEWTLLPVHHPGTYSSLALSALRTSFHQRDWHQVLKLYHQIYRDILPMESRAEATFYAGYSAFKLRKLDSAYRYFEEVLLQAPQSDPWASASRFYLGYIRYYQKKWTSAYLRFLELRSHPLYRQYIYFYLADAEFWKAYPARDFSTFFRYADSALQSAGNIHTLFPRRIYLLQAYAYYLQEKPDSAIAPLRKYLALGGIYDYQMSLILASLYLKQNRCDSVLAYTRPLLNRTDTFSRWAALLHGECLRRQGNLQEAIVWYNRALYSPISPAPVRKIAGLHYLYTLLELRQYNEATRLIEWLLDSLNLPEPERNELMALLPRVLIHSQNYARAYQVLKKVHRKFPGLRSLYQRVTVYLGLQELASRNVQRAQKLLETAVQIQEERATTGQAHFWLGYLAYQQEQYTRAVNHWTSAYQLLPDSLFPEQPGMALYGIAYARYRKKNYPECAILFQQAREWWQSFLESSPIAVDETLRTQLEPYLRDAWLRQADCHILAQNYRTAASVLNQFLQEGPPPYDYALYYLGRLASILGNPDQAIVYFHRLIRQYPKSSHAPPSAFYLGQLYFQQNQYPEAFQAYTFAIRSKSPEWTAPALAERALVAFHMDMPDTTLADIQRLYESYPEARQIYAHLLSTVRAIYVHKGQPEAYFAFVSRYFEKQPEPKEELNLFYESLRKARESENCEQIISLATRMIEKYDTARSIPVIHAHLWRGECWFQDQKYQEALSDYLWLTQHASLNPSLQVHAHLRAGWISLHQLKDSSQSAYHYWQALSLTESEVLEHQILQTLVILLPTYLSPEQRLQAAHYLRNHPRASEADRLLSTELIADLHYAEGLLDSALIYYQELAELTRLEPGIKARFRIARILMEREKYQEARKYMDQILHETPTDDYWVARTYVLLGWWFYLQGNPEQALAILESVYENYPGEDVRQEAREKIRMIRQQLAPESPHPEATEPDAIYLDGETRSDVTPE